MKKLEIILHKATDDYFGINKESNKILEQRVREAGILAMKGLSPSVRSMHETKKMLETKEKCERLKSEISKSILCLLSREEDYDYCYDHYK